MGARTRKRLGTKVAIVSVAALALGAFGVAATPAGANAPNPNADISATGQVNSDGTVTVNLNGTWVWPGQNCEGRWGEGWAVDWWGVSASQTPSPNFTLSNVSLIPSFGQRTTGSQSAAGAIQLADHTGYFHVGSMYNDETVNSATTCQDVTISGQQGSQGAWTATATYPNASDIPPNICVNGYDEHGNEGKPGGNDDISPINDHDNSIQTNAFNPASGMGYCTTPKIRGNLNLSIVKTNDANGDGTFTKSETAKTAGATVPFKAVITNNSTVAMVIDSLTDAWPSMPAFSLDSACPGIVGSTLAAGASTTCSFSEANYAPASGQSVTNMVSTTGHQVGIPDNTKTVTDTSTVTTNTPPPPQTGYIEICKQESGTGLEDVLFTFTVQGKSVQVPVGACSAAIKVNAGNVTVTEVGKPGAQFVSAATIPADRLLQVNPQSASVVIKVVPGNVSTQTIVTFTNKLKPGSGYVKICKVAGAGVAVGTKFNFSVDGGATVAVPAGPGAGYCVIAGQFSFGNHTIVEASSTTTHVTAISVAPAGRTVSTSTSGRSAKVTVGGGVTEVTFTNAANA
jgi:hypothetical protein